MIYQSHLQQGFSGLSAALRRSNVEQEQHKADHGAKRNKEKQNRICHRIQRTGRIHAEQLTPKAPNQHCTHKVNFGLCPSARDCLDFLHTGRKAPEQMAHPRALRDRLSCVTRHADNPPFSCSIVLPSGLYSTTREIRRRNACQVFGWYC